MNLILMLSKIIHYTYFKGFHFSARNITKAFYQQIIFVNYSYLKRFLSHPGILVSPLTLSFLSTFVEEAPVLITSSSAASGISLALPSRSTGL